MKYVTASLVILVTANFLPPSTVLASTTTTTTTGPFMRRRSLGTNDFFLDMPLIIRPTTEIEAKRALLEAFLDLEMSLSMSMSFGDVGTTFSEIPTPTPTAAPTAAPTVSDDNAILSLDPTRSPTDPPLTVDLDDIFGIATTEAPTLSPVETPSDGGAVDPNESSLPDAVKSPDNGSSKSGMGMLWIAVAVVAIAALIMGSLWYAKSRRQQVAKGMGAVSQGSSSLSSNSRLVEV